MPHPSAWTILQALQLFYKHYTRFQCGLYGLGWSFYSTKINTRMSCIINICAWNFIDILEWNYFPSHYGQFFKNYIRFDSSQRRALHTMGWFCGLENHMPMVSQSYQYGQCTDRYRLVIVRILIFCIFTRTIHVQPFIKGPNKYDRSLCVISFGYILFRYLL